MLDHRNQYGKRRLHDIGGNGWSGRNSDAAGRDSKQSCDCFRVLCDEKLLFRPG